MGMRLHCRGRANVPTWGMSDSITSSVGSSFFFSSVLYTILSLRGLQVVFIAHAFERC